MYWLIAVINIFSWGIASLILAVGSESMTFGIYYFLVGYPLSLVFLRLSDKHGISKLDKFTSTTMSLWKKRLIWSNGYATAFLWIIVFIVIFLYSL